MPTTIRPKDEEVFKKDGFRCVYCGFDGNDFIGWTFLQVDHFMPRSRGGSDAIENLMTSCCICNLMKNDRVWENVEVARQEIGVWRRQMREYWETNVRPLIRHK